MSIKATLHRGVIRADGDLFKLFKTEGYRVKQRNNEMTQNNKDEIDQTMIQTDRHEIVNHKHN